MVNFSKLNNVTALNIDTTNISDVNTMVSTMITTANNTSQGYLGLAIMVVVFFVLTYVTFKDNGDIRLDILKSILMSSGLTIILGTVLLVVGISSSFQHLVWFVVIFTLAVLGSYNLKKKGL